MARYRMLLFFVVLAFVGCAGTETPVRSPGRPQPVAERHNSPAPSSQPQALAQTQAPAQEKRAPSKPGPDTSLEGCRNTPPDLLVDRSGCPIPIYVRVSLSYVTDDALHQPQVLEQLEAVAKLLNQNATAKATIEAHAEAAPNAEALTLRRADALKWLLTSKYNAPADRIDALGLGASKPLIANDTPDGRERNRRVDILVKGHFGRTPPPGSQALAPSSSASAETPAPPATPAPSPAAPTTTPPTAPTATPTTTAPITPATPPAKKPSRPTGSFSLPGRPASPTDPLLIHYGRKAIDVDPAYNQQLEAAGRYLKAHPGATVTLESYTDANGGAGVNRMISEERALRVKELLLRSFDLDPDRIAVKAFGETNFLADNATDEGRTQNRRVAIKLAPAADAIREPLLADAYVPPAAKPQTAAASQPPLPVREPAAAAPPEGVIKTEVATSLPPPAPRRLARGQLGKTLSVMQPADSPGRETSKQQASLPDKGQDKADPLDGRSGRYSIEVSVSQCKLWLYEQRDDGKKRLVSEYDVATAKRGISYPTGAGYITGVDFHPSWVPTPSTLRDAQRKGKRLPRYVPPGSRSNPMGEFKILLSHGNAYRIHGTNAPSQIGQRVSRGCIRMHNNEGMQLAKRVSVGAEVLIRD